MRQIAMPRPLFYGSRGIFKLLASVGRAASTLAIRRLTLAPILRASAGAGSAIAGAAASCFRGFGFRGVL